MKYKDMLYDVFIFAMLLAMVMAMALVAGCTPRANPTVVYQDKIVTRFDTLTFLSEKTDTIPCDDFNYFFADKLDTVFVEVVKNQLKIKTVQRTDTVYRDVNIIANQAKKIDNRVKNIAKKGSAIGDGNTITTKKTNWWWIFFAGFLTAHLLRMVLNKLFGGFVRQMWNMTI